MSFAPARLRLVLRLAVAFLLCCGLGLALLMLARRNYGEKLMAQNRLPSTAVPPAIQPNKDDAPLLVLLGDSRMVDWGLPELKGYRVANWAVNGSSSAQTAERAREMLARTKPHTVVLQVGINDLKLLGPKPGLSEEITDSVTSNTIAIVQDCRRAGARVILLPVWPTGPVDWRRRVVWSDVIEAARLKVNDRVRSQVLALDGIRVLDLFKNLPTAQSRATDANLFHDTLHLNPATYGPLTERLGNELAGTNGPARTASKGN
jgi:lysophospholipase L1-like esterase